MRTLSIKYFAVLVIMILCCFCSTSYAEENLGVFFNPDELSIVEQGQNRGIMDSNGNWVVECKYSIWEDDHDLGFYLMSSDDPDSDVMGFYDSVTGFLIEPRKMTVFPPWDRNEPVLAGICVDDSAYGFVNTATGRLDIPFQFDIIAPFRDGLSYVGIYHDGFTSYEEGILHSDGMLFLLKDYLITGVVSPDLVIVGAWDPNARDSFGEGLISGYGLVDSCGQIIIEPVYDFIFKNAWGELIVRQGDTFSSIEIGEDGRIIWGSP